MGVPSKIGRLHIYGGELTGMQAGDVNNEKNISN